MIHVFFHQEFLGFPCYTPDCTGKITAIRIFDESANLKHCILDKNEKPDALKQKKKKYVYY